MTRILEAFDAEVLADADCFFVGGSAIAMALDLYRETVDIDFLCASAEGFQKLRNMVSTDLGDLLKSPLKQLREVRKDRDKIMTFLEVEGTPVKIELFRETRVSVSGEIDPASKLPTLSRSDFFSQKLMANADRWAETSVFSRDIIDLAMMIQGWGDIPKEAWDKATNAYGRDISRCFHYATRRVSDQKHLANCLARLKMDPWLIETIPVVLDRASSRLPLHEKEMLEKQRRIRNIPALKDSAGAAHIFWKHAMAARNDDGFEDVDWSEIERKTIFERLEAGAQFAGEIVDVINEHSPGAVDPERQKTILHHVFRIAENMNFMQDRDS